MVHRATRLRLLWLVPVPIALLTAVGGLVISQAAAGRSDIRALLYGDTVRFTVQNEKMALLRVELFNLAALFSTKPRRSARSKPRSVASLGSWVCQNSRSRRRPSRRVRSSVNTASTSARLLPP